MKRSGPASAVVDTNLIVSGLILKRGRPYELVEALRRGAFHPVLSEPLRVQYGRVLVRPKFAQRYGITPEEVASFLFLVDSSVRQIAPSRRLPVPVRDKNDEIVLATALGRAEYLVTGDNDLLELRDDPRIGKLKIVTVREFLEALGSR